MVDKATTILKLEWSRLPRLAESGPLADTLDDRALVESIRAATNSVTKSYRYVLPTQLVAKLAHRSIDCRCLQKTRGGAGAFDARSVAHDVVVPFDQANENVLGGSPEPYVNNPLRVAEVSANYRAPQKNKADWDTLCTVLEAVEHHNTPAFTMSVFRQVLREIYRRLSDVHVTYPVPRRASLEKALSVIEEFLTTPSGGDRLLALTAALFTVIGRRFRLFAAVRRAAITAADASTGMLADIECVAETGEILLAVEVKDRVLTIEQLRGKMDGIREKQVSEVFFIAQQETAGDPNIQALQEHEFAAGHNIYITDFLSLSRAALALLGEAGRKDFLRDVGRQLDEYRSDITHRRAWAEELRRI